MAPPAKKFTFQKQEKQYHEHCCVPQCTASSAYSAGLSFHAFPLDEALRRQWLVLIRRDRFAVTSHSKVCSRHFLPGDISEAKSEGGKRRLKKGVVPVLFKWNNFKTPPSRPSVWERVDRPASFDDPPDEQPMECAAVVVEHDYASVPEPAAMDMAATENHQLKEKIRLMEIEMEKLKIQASFGLERFAGSDDDIRFYTRFASYRHLKIFWSLIQPSVPLMIRTSRAKAAERKNETISLLRPTHTSLQPIDEFFLFLMYLAAGLKERDLANRFSVHQSTVSRIISSWTNYLYTVLGSACIWMEKDDVQANLPEVFQDFSDTQIIVDCTELRCQTPSSLLLQSEMYSNYKSHCTMKGLIGMAPHGAITFVSSLYEGSISDKELFRCSGLPDLLTDDMAIMVDKGFSISDVVKCKVYCPPFLQKRRQMPVQSVLQTQKIARLRVHVERVIRRVKENKLFSNIIPLSISGNVNELFSVACLLVNYQNKPLVRAWVK